jgi:hypothetical protein
VTRMTTSISLVLISSALILAGCAGEPPPNEADKDKDKDGRSAHHPSGGHFHPWYYRGPSWGGYAGRGGTSRSGTSGGFHSGGFGSSGHAAGS